MENTYWNSKGRYQEAAQALHNRVPVEGAVADPKRNRALERYRRATNCYYDLYNNGLGNRAAEFRSVFGFSAVRDSRVKFK